MTIEHKITTKSRTDAFSSVAFWQLMVFVFLLSFVWLNEFVDIPHIVFDTDPTPFNPYRAAMLSAGIVTAAVIAVGHTYEKQRTLVRQLVETCLYCHRVRNAAGKWEHVEEYFIRNYPVSLDCTACPDCQRMLDRIASDEKTTPPPGEIKPEQRLP